MAAVSKEIVWRRPVLGDEGIKALAASQAGSANLTASEEAAGWRKIGQYKVNEDVKVTHIYPKLRNGKTIRVTSVKATISLVCTRSGSRIDFTAYTHRGRVFFRDSRVPQPIPFRELASEVKRMLGSEGQALVIKALHSIG